MYKLSIVYKFMQPRILHYICSRNKPPTIRELFNLCGANYNIHNIKNNVGNEQYTNIKKLKSKSFHLFLIQPI